MSIEDLRFLVAEDHRFQRRTLVRMLEGLGVKSIDEAADGSAALAIVRDSTRPVDIRTSLAGVNGRGLESHVPWRCGRSSSSPTKPCQLST